MGVLEYIKTVKKESITDNKETKTEKKKPVDKKLKKPKKYTSDEFIVLQSNKYAGVDIDKLSAPQLKKYNDYLHRESLKQKLIDSTPSTYKLVDTVAQLQKTLGWIIKHKPMLAVDTETTGLDVVDDVIVGMSFGFKSNGQLFNFYVPIRHKTGQNIAPEEAIKFIKVIMEDEDIPKIMCNAVFDISMFATENVRVKGLYMDVQVAIKCLVEDRMTYSLKDLAKVYLKMEDAVPYADLFGKGTSYAEVDPKYYAYPCKDTDMTYGLYELIEEKFNKPGFEKVKSVYFDIEHPLIQTVAEMKMTGMLLDEDRFKDVRRVLSGNVERLEGQLKEEVGKVLSESKLYKDALSNPEDKHNKIAKQIDKEGFNFNSPNQKAFLFYDILGCKEKEEGKRTTDKNFMAEVENKFTIAKVFSEYSAEAKLFSSFTDNLKEKQSKDGKIRPSFNQYGTKTGRFSCNSPNFQQLPSKRDEIRSMFKAPDGMLLLGADYSQIELRILAHFSQDANLLEAYKTGKDIHTQTACLVFGHKYEEANRLNKEMDAGHIDEDHPEYAKAKEVVKHRKYSKTINFGLIYGMSAKGLSEQLGVTKSEAEEFIEKYFEGLPTVQAFMESQKQKAYKLGYVETLDGRRRRLHKELFGSDRGKRASAERQSANFVIQGTAADLLKKAMPIVQEYLKTLHPEASIVAQIHDELIMQVPETITQTQIKTITDLMCNVMKFDVPLGSDPEIMKFWTEKVPMENLPI